MELLRVRMADVIPYEGNPRNNEMAVNAVAESIRQCGYVSPIIVDENMVILAGHTRYKALTRLGWNEITVGVARGLTDEQKRKYRILDNKTNELAEWDFNALALELDGLDFDGFDFGFDDDVNDEFGTEFSLPDGDKPDICQMTFTLHNDQKQFIEYCLGLTDHSAETFGNTNKNGNALYEVCVEWAGQRK